MCVSGRVWQHVDCMSIERGNIPEVYFCEECQPREVDRKSAAQLQKSKKQLFEQMKEGGEAQLGLSSPRTLPSISNHLLCL